MDLQEALNQLLSEEDYDEDISQRLVTQHLSGEGNIASDLVSRGLWEEFTLMCEVLRVRPVHMPLDTREQHIVRAVVTAAAHRSRRLSSLATLEDAIEESAKRKGPMMMSSGDWSDMPSAVDITSDDERHLTEEEQGRSRDHEEGQ